MTQHPLIHPLLDRIFPVTHYIVSITNKYILLKCTYLTSLISTKVKNNDNLSGRIPQITKVAEAGLKEMSCNCGSNTVLASSSILLQFQKGTLYSKKKLFLL